MPAKHHIDNENRIIITTWEGEANENELIASLRQYQKDTQKQPEYADYNEVLNLYDVTAIKVTTDGIRKISELASITDEKNTKKKLAIIVRSTLAYGLARMYIVYRSFSINAKKEIRVFKNKEEALVWVINK